MAPLSSTRLIAPSMTRESNMVRVESMPHLLVLVLLTTLVEPSPSINGNVANNDELVRTVILQNDAAYRRIKSCAYEIELINHSPYVVGAPEELPREDRKESSRLKVQARGDLFLIERRTQLQTLSGSWKQDQEFQAVLNERYFAIYRGEPVNAVYLHEHKSIAAMRSGENDQSRGLLDPIPMKYACGDGVSTIRELYEGAPKEAEWLIGTEPLEGESVYKITYRVPLKDGRKRHSCFYVDPKKDYLLRRIEYFDNDGQPRIFFETELQFVEAGQAWFPKRIHVKYYDEGKGESWQTISNVRINPEIASNLFTIESFKLPPETRMRRFVGGTKEIRYQYKDGVWSLGSGSDGRR